MASSGLHVYSSVVDLVLQTALGFGMVIVLLENVLAEFRTENEDLKEAHRKLLQTANTDSLTAAFNRHAFHGFVNRNGEDGSPVSGCVGFFDIDDLKGINDCYGHSAGDAVIRCVAGSIRNIVRAEDLIYRWGGDEFFVIMISMESELAEKRMSRLETSLRSVKIDHIPEPVDIGVSWGFTDFRTMDGIEQAIASADAAMYHRKQTRKLRRSSPIPKGSAEIEMIPAGL